MQWLENISIGFAIHAILLLATIPRILAIKRDPTTAIAWIFGVLLMPFFGVVAFWMIGDPEVRGPLRRIMQGPPIHTLPDTLGRLRSEAGTRVPRVQILMARLGETPPTEGNEVEFYNTGVRLYRDLEDAIREARHEICLQYYIFRADEDGLRFAQLLRRKARQGVRVCFLYDAMGSSDLSARFIARLRRAGVESYPFLPLSLLRRRVQINFRNHRKLLIVDRKVAFTGGFNIGREHVERRPRMGHWFDAHLKLKGPIVDQLVEEFAADWDFASGRAEAALNPRPEWHVPNRVLFDVKRKWRGWVQTVSAGPDQQENRVRSLMFYAFTHARRRLWIASPYLVPDAAIITALVTAALSGVDVRILTQNNRPDQWIPHFAARYFYELLMDAGVKIYQYRPGMMHAKMFIMDNRIASVGSANVDVRSLALNFESNCVFYSRQELRRVEAIYLEAIAQSDQLGDAFRNRRYHWRVIENCARLFAPVL